MPKWPHTLQAGAAGHNDDTGGQVRVAGRYRQRQAAAQGVPNDSDVRRPQLGGEVADERYGRRYESINNNTLPKRRLHYAMKHES